MKTILWDGAEELAVGLGITFLLATASALVHVIFGGWKGFRHFLSVWVVAIFAGIMAQWGCQHFGIAGPAMAAIICSASILSYVIMGVLFHPAITDAIVARIKMEIQTRGRSGSRNNEGAE